MVKRSNNQTVSNSDVTSNSLPSRVIIFDCNSIFQVIDYLKKQCNNSASVKFNYDICVKYFAESCFDYNLSIPQLSVAFAIVDPGSEGQLRFVDALIKSGIVVHKVDIKNAIGTLPVGVSCNSHSSILHEITYYIGLLAARPNPEVIVVSRYYELYSVLFDFVINRGGRAAIAYPFKFLDGRWFEFFADDHIKFINLNSESIFGVDISYLSDKRSSGLSDI